MDNPLGSAWFPIKWHETQERLFNSPVRFPVVPAGRRSGKTLRAKRYTTLQSIITKKHDDIHTYFCAAPTRDQAKAIFWDDIKALTKKFWRREPNETQLIVYVGGLAGHESYVRVLGLDKPERIEGVPWDGGVIDEYRKIKPHAWDKHVRPALSTTGREGWCWRCGVPEGRNHYYDLAVQASGGIPSTIPGKGVFSQGDDPETAYYSWHSLDILSPKEIESARKTMDPKTFRQEYEGSFESEEGLVYYAYTPDYYPNGNLSKDVCYDKNLPVYVGFDFNVDPMTAVCFQIKRNEDGEEVVHVYRGYFIRNCNTKTLIDKIISEHKNTSTFYITTCQSGGNRQTSADIGVTDRRIIKNAIYESGRTCRFFNRSKNPTVRDKINCTNSMLFHNRILINPTDSGCKELMRDLESLIRKEGTSDIDTSDPMRGHISDALAYPIERHFPISLEGKKTLSDVIL